MAAQALPSTGQQDEAMASLDRQMATVYHSQGRTCEKQERYAEALEAYQQALELLDVEQEPQFYGVVLHDIADVYQAQGQLGQALEYYQRAAEAKKRGNNPGSLVSTLRALADVQVELEQETKALQVLESCLDLLRGLPAPEKPRQLAGVLVSLGQIYLAQEQPEAALPYLEEARSLMREEGVATPEEVLSVLALLTTVYRTLRREEDVAQTQVAAQALLPMGQVMEPTEQQRAIVYHRLGRAYEQEEQYEEALEAYQQALQLLDVEQEPQFYGVVLHDIGDVYRAQRKLERALEYYQRAAKAKELGNNPSSLVITLRALADVQLRLGQEAEALHLLMRAVYVLRELPAPGEPKRLAGVLVQLGQVYLAQAQPKQAVPCLEEARTLMIEDGVATPEEMLGVLALLATIYKALGRHDEVAVIQAVAKTLPAESQQDGATTSLDPQMAVILHNQGRIYEQKERYAQALEAYQQALQLLDVEREPQTYGVILHDIGDVYEAQEQLEQALSYYQRAAEAKERGNSPSDLVTTLQTLAGVQVERGQVTEALQSYERCLALLQGLPAPGEPDRQAEIHHERGRVYERQRQYDQALEAYQQGLQLVDVEHDPPFYGVVLHDIADVYRVQERFEQALGYYQRAAEAKAQGDNPSDLVITLRALAEVQLKLGQEAEALQVLEQDAHLLRELPAPGDPKRLAGVLVLLGHIYLAQEQSEAALPYLEEARSLVMEEGVATPQEILVILALLMTTYAALGREEEAVQTQATAQALLPMDQVMEPTEQQRAIIHHQLGRLYEEEERYEEALEAYEQALQLLDVEQEPQFYGVVLHDIADVYRVQGELEQALEYYQRAAKAKERGENVRDLVTTLRMLADVQLELGQETEALQVLEKCLTLLRELPAPGEPKRLAGVLVLLGQIYLAQAQPETALPYLEKARTLKAEEGVAAPQEQLSILTLLATTYVALGQNKQADQALLSADQQEQAAVSPYTKALEIYQQALQLLDAEHESQTYGVVLYGIGSVYQVQGELEQAMGYYQRAREAKMRGDNRIDLVITMQALANVQLQLGQVAEALSVYQECLDLLGELPSSGEFERSELRPNDPGILMQVARCQEALNSWAEAIDTYKLLEGILLEEFRQEPNPTALRRLAWTKYKLGMFEEAAKLCNQVDAPETDIDKARARLIAASIAYISGDQSATKDNFHYVSTNVMLTSDLKWEVKHDIRYVIKYHELETDLEQFQALIDAT
jgi:tetratricopeptide (TPR) repeat protein